VLAIADENNPVYPDNLAKTCGACHDDPAFAEQFPWNIKRPAEMYSLSVHGKLVEEGCMDAANCSLCHGKHDIKNRIQPGSSISSFNVPDTCGQCHEEITREYKESVHWIYAKKGVKQAPVCNDCHSEHATHAINTLHEEEEVRKIQEETCHRCHSNPLMAKKFNTTGEQSLNYQDSYHGLAVMRGDLDAATCIDCHGVHKILPKLHPQSSIHVDNVKETCKACHEKASDLFSMSYSHKTESAKAFAVETWVRRIYIWLISLVIGGMLVHNGIIFIAEMRRRRSREKKRPVLTRLSINEVTQHAFLVTSFVLLAITGFLLKYPDSWWAGGLAKLGMTESARQMIHRVAAVVIMVLGFYHVIYLIFTARGRRLLGQILPRLRDIGEVWTTLRYYLRSGRKAPQSERFDYTEKAEYWALIWGTVVMAITGLVLWFPTMVGDWAPLWFIKVNEIIHFYEAILATLAILVWHLFFVIFHPKYPMEFTWLDGNMSLERYKHHHGQHFRTMLADWKANQAGIRDSLESDTREFVAQLEKRDYDPDEIIESVLNGDGEMREWVETRLKEFEASAAEKEPGDKGGGAE